MTVPIWVEPVARQLLRGLLVTIELSVVSGVVSLIIGVVLGTIQTFPSRILRLVVRAYVEVWRGLPIVLTLFFIFFTLPVLGISVPSLAAALIGLTLWTSANMAETVRGSVISIDRGQHEAASAVGMTWLQAMRWVILPQAVRRMLPPSVSLLTNLVQSSALAAIISVPDLLLTAQRQIARLTFSGNSHSIEILGAVMVLYFLICFPLTRISARLESRRAT